MAPEMLAKSASKNGYDGKAADIWSLGITLYCFYYLDIPYKGNNF